MLGLVGDSAVPTCFGLKARNDSGEPGSTSRVRRRGLRVAMWALLHNTQQKTNGGSPPPHGSFSLRATYKLQRAICKLQGPNRAEVSSLVFSSPPCLHLFSCSGVIECTRVSDALSTLIWVCKTKTLHVA